MSRLFESLQRVIELTPSGIMVPETMLKLAHLQLELEPKDSYTGTLCQLEERYWNTQEGQEVSGILEDFE